MTNSRQLSDQSQQTKGLLIAVDILMLSLMFLFVILHFINGEWNLLLACWFLSYVISLIILVPSAQDRLVKSVAIIARSLTSALLMSMLFIAEINVFTGTMLNLKQIVAIISAAVIAFVTSRSISRMVLKTLRKRGQDNRNVIMVGSANSLRALYDRMGNDISVGYTILGYFNNGHVPELDEVLEYLGTFPEVYDYVEHHNVDMIFCNSDSIGKKETTEFMDYCENHLIHYYSVPSLPNYCHRRMNIEFVYEIPIMSIRREPLSSPLNRLLKRTFDVVISALFLVTCFWWIYIIVAIVTKITMPGPVLFRQQRNGWYGETFTCLKFRSMKVNNESDTLQATKDDPRKTRWGSILRKTNIDELPQFINVLKGEMSIVGPRPHMIKHTEQYRELVDKYMVRHYAKPGITGWAQVTGSRGETSELWMMEERINKDIWYVENWSILLDFIIIIKTILNALGQEKGNAY